MRSQPRTSNTYNSKTNRNASSYTQKVKGKDIYSDYKLQASLNGPVEKNDGSTYYGPVFFDSSSGCVTQIDSYTNWFSSGDGRYYCVDDSGNIVYKNSIYSGVSRVSNNAPVDVSNTIFSVAGDNSECCEINSNAISDLSALINDVSENVFDNSRVIVELNSELDDLSGVVQDLSSNVHDLSGEIFSLPSVVNDLSSVVLDLSGDHNTLNTAFLDLSGKVVTNTSNILTNTNNITSLTGVVNDLSSVVLDLSGDHNTLNTAFLDLSGDHNTLNTTFLDLSGKIVRKAGDTITGDLALSGNIGIDFSNALVPTTTTNKLYRHYSGTDYDNLFFDGKLIPQAIVASNQTYITLPTAGGTGITKSYFASFNPGYNDGYLTRIEGPSGVELRFNTDSATGIVFRMEHSANITNYNMSVGIGNWVSGSQINHGAIGLAKYISYDYNDGTRIIDNNKVRVRINNNDMLLVQNNTNTTYNDGDIIILQQRRGGVTYSSNSGGLRLYNANTDATWAIFTNDAYDLNFAYNGNNRSYLNDTGYDSQLNFTAFHRSVVEDNITTNWEKYTGLIVETTGEYNNIFYNKEKQNARYTPAVKEALPNVRLTTKLGSKAVFGVLSNKEELKYDNTKRAYNTGGYQGHLYDIDTNDPVEMNKRYDIASVGECAVWIIKNNETSEPENGDLFMSSDKQVGYGEIQPDGVVKNITVGKLTCSWDNPNLDTRQIGDYTAKLMGCVLYCG